MEGGRKGGMKGRREGGTDEGSRQARRDRGRGWLPLSDRAANLVRCGPRGRRGERGGERILGREGIREGTSGNLTLMNIVDIYKYT